MTSDMSMHVFGNALGEDKWVLNQIKGSLNGMSGVALQQLALAIEDRLDNFNRQGNFYYDDDTKECRLCMTYNSCSNCPACFVITAYACMREFCVIMTYKMRDKNCDNFTCTYQLLLYLHILIYSIVKSRI